MDGRRGSPLGYSKTADTTPQKSTRRLCSLATHLPLSPPALPGRSAARFPQCQMAGSVVEGGRLTQVTVARTHFSGLGRQEDEWSREFWEAQVRSHCIILPQGRGELELLSARSAAARGHRMTSTTTTSSIRSTCLGESRTSLRLFFFFFK